MRTNSFDGWAYVRGMLMGFGIIWFGEWIVGFHGFAGGWQAFVQFVLEMGGAWYLGRHHMRHAMEKKQ